jgi:ArsR family transcriptional regulator, arsenate/arsenite/antimonite-responsive transcriptional repressor
MLRELTRGHPNRLARLTARRTDDTNGHSTHGAVPREWVATMWNFMAVTKALADENRVRMFLALRKQELCVCQIIELVGLAPSTVSKHMSILRAARLVDGRKEGRWMYYRMAGADASPTVRGAVEWVRKSLADDPQVTADTRRLEAILKLDVHKLCESQCAPKCKGGKPRAKTAGRVRL